MQEKLAFKSFVMAGFECTAAKVENNRRLDLLAATKHDVLCSDDYQLIKDIGISTVREGFNWSRVESIQGKYDFTFYNNMLKAGSAYGIQQIWDLTHFDYPDFYDPFGGDFIDRFSAYAVACVKTIRQYQTGTLFIVPMNEISFFTWIGADKGWWAPYKKGVKNGRRFKQILVKTALKAMDAIWREEPNVRFIQVDPFMRRIATEPSSSASRSHVAEFNQVVRFQAWDLLSGMRQPELGGSSKYLDIIGVNYYTHNQEWVHAIPSTGMIKHQMIDWDSPDRVSFADMLESIYERYHRPILISESGSFGEYRERWWKRLVQEIEEAKERQIPILGVCIYPTVDRPETAGFLLPNSGIWDFECDDESCQRIPHQPSQNIIRDYALAQTQT